MIPYVDAENLRAMPVGETRMFLGEPKQVTMLAHRSKKQAQVYTVEQALCTVVRRVDGGTFAAILVTKLTQHDNPVPPKRRGAPTGTRALWKIRAEEAERAGDRVELARIMEAQRNKQRKPRKKKASWRPAGGFMEDRETPSRDTGEKFGDNYG